MSDKNRQSVLNPPAEPVKGTSAAKFVLAGSLLVALLLTCVALLYSLANRASHTDILGNLKQTVTRQIEQGGKLVDSLSEATKDVITTENKPARQRSTKSRKSAQGSYTAPVHFTLDDPQFAGRQVKTWVYEGNAAKHPNYRSEWRFWGRADGAKPAFMIGFLSWEGRKLSYRPVNEAVGKFGALKGHSPNFYGERFSIDTPYGDVTAQYFHIAPRRGSKTCIGFQQMRNGNQQAIKGYACPAPNARTNLAAVRCLIAKANHPAFAPATSANFAPCPQLSRTD